MRVAVHFAPGFEEVEGLTVVDILRRANIQTVMVGVHNEKVVEGSHGIKIVVDKLLEEVDYEKLDMIVLPGGQPGTKNLEANDEFRKKIIECDLDEKYIASICAGPSIIGKMGFLEDREATCYPAVKDTLFGAKYRDDLPVIVDGRFITSRGLGTAIDFSLKLVEILESKEEVEKIREAILHEKK